MVNMTDVKKLTNDIEVANQTITEARLKRDMLTNELKKKAQAYYSETGTKLTTNISEVDALKTMVTQQLQSTLTFLENILGLFHAQDYVALSEAMGVKPTSDLEKILDFETEDVMETSNETSELKQTQAPQKVETNSAPLVGLDLTLDTPMVEDSITSKTDPLAGLNLNLSGPVEQKPNKKEEAPKQTSSGLSLDLGVSGLTLDLGSSTPTKQQPEALDSTKPLNIATATFTQQVPIEKDMDLLGANVTPEVTSINEEIVTPTPVMPALNLNLDLGISTATKAPETIVSTPKLDLSGFDSSAFEDLLDMDNDFELPDDEEEPDEL